MGGGCGRWGGGELRDGLGGRVPFDACLRLQLPQIASHARGHPGLEVVSAAFSVAFGVGSSVYLSVMNVLETMN